MTNDTLRLVFPGFRFGSDDPAEAQRLVSMGVGGFCLYEGDVAEIASFTRRMQEKAKFPLLFCADYEDGLGSHVPDGTRFPSNMALGAAGSEDLARLKGRLTAREARALGVQWVLAPVVDLATRPENPIVNLRSFGEDPNEVSRLALAYMEGLLEGGALNCLKHFPGHGETSADSHLELPDLPVPERTLRDRELVPFQRGKAAAHSVMVAHLKAGALDPDRPTSLSKKAVGELLRREMGYDGLVTTDALSMQAIAGTIGEVEAARLALGAGVDILLVPQDAKKLVYGLLRLESPDLEPHVRSALGRLEKAVRIAESPSPYPLPQGERDPGRGGLDLVGCADHLHAAEEMARQAVTWVSKGLLPKGRSPVSYLEPDASGEEEWQGAEFVRELRSLGLEVKPHDARSSGPLVVGIFLRPRAYSGRIQLDDEELARVEKARANATFTAVVSLGSPFVFGQVRKYDSGLCTFSSLEASQKAAAQALAGEMQASGKLPIKLWVKTNLNLSK